MRRLFRVVPLLLAVLAAGCEEGPTRPSGSVTLTFDGTAPAAQSIASHAFTSDRRGIATAVLTWSNGAVDLDFIVTPASCGDPLVCDNRSISQDVGTTSEQIVFGVDEDEPLILWVRNFAGGAQPYSISLTIE
jgi:hypothetical protein